MTARAARLRQSGHDIISLSAGEPDFETPDHINEAAVAAIRTGQTKYTAVDGSPALKQAVIAKFERDNGLTFRDDEVLISSGGKQSLYNACQALLNDGDEVIIPAPYWVSFPDMVRLADARPVIVPTTPETGFRLTPESLTAAITPRTRAIIVNSPCNPTGSAYTRTHWETIGEVLAAHPGIFMIADDIYEHIYWGPEPFCSFLSACPQLRDRALTVNGVSKCYAMTGWRIGYCAGPKAVIKAMTTIQGQSTTNACSISQAAATAALLGDQTPVATMCAEFRARHEFVLDGIDGLAGVHCRPCDGAFYAFPEITAAIESLGLRDDADFCERLLERQGVALVPGSAFGAPGHVRLSFAAGLDTLQAALDRLHLFLK